MILRILTSLFIAAFLIMTLGCQRDVDLLEPATNPTFGEVFLDGFVAGLDYSAFSNSKYDAFDVDTEEYFKGTSSIKIIVPGENDPSGWFAGGAFYSKFPRDLSGYNALTFWGKADKTALAEIGFGNDNAGNSLYPVMQKNVLFGTSWKKYIIPIPFAAKLTAETGMLQYAAGADENGYGSKIWLDEVQYEKLNTIAYPRPVISSTTIEGEVGDVIDAGVTGVTFNVDGADQTVDAASAYFTLTSSNDAVAVPTADGKITAVSEGTAEITVKLGTVEASEKITVTVFPPTAKPITAAPTPTASADSVISLFSNAYTNVTVDTWNPFWEYSTAEVTDLQIVGDDVKRYTNLNFVGIEFTSQAIDASDMTHFHLDIWTPDSLPSAEFSAKLVDFGADGAYGGGDDSDVEIKVSSPTLVSKSWIGIDLSLTGLPSRGHVAQLILVGNDNLNTVYVDNAYFYMGDDGGVILDGPTQPAPTPAHDAADVISLFSNAYTDVTVDTWNPGWQWSTAVVEDVQVAGDDVKKYTSLNFVGIEFTSQTIDATNMTHFHLDFWTPDPAEAPAELKIQLVDFGADGLYDGGDDTSHELSFTSPTLVSDTWVSLDIPLTSFTGLTNKAHLAQLVLSSADGAYPNTIYMDNIYLHSGGGSSATEPSTAAPTPSYAAGDVISLFSNAYTNVTVDTWSADWPDDADVADVQIGGDDVKLYTNLAFAGIEFTSQTIDASTMTHFHMNVWTADATAAPAVFKVKLVDFGADGAWSGGDDVEHELELNDTTTPAMATGSWVALDIPLSDFTGMTTNAHVAQLIIAGDPNTVYVDNVLFHK